MSDALAVYLHDHLAGSHFAVKLLDSLHHQVRDETFGQFAAALKADIEEDQETLEKIVDQVGKATIDLTEAAGWFAAKASQVKLKRDDPQGGVGTFEALETLMLGIRGKISLWQVLPVIRKVDTRIPDNDYDKMVARGEEQCQRVDTERLKMALIAFRLDT